MDYPSTISSIFSIIPEMIQQFESLGRKVAESIQDYSFIRVISHNDADGLTAAGIMSHALLRSGKIFQTTIVSNLDHKVIDQVNQQVLEKDCAVIFCDMGSGQPELIEQVKSDVIIIDHHQIVGDHSGHPHINPHIVGLDGSTQLSASGTAYFVARAMGDFIDLAGLALTGAIGDKQKMVGPNADILKEAVNHNVISTRLGLLVPDGPAEEVLTLLLEPFLDCAGDGQAAGAFLRELGIGGNIQELDEEELNRLASAMALNISKRADPAVIQSMVGNILTLNKEVVPNIYSLEWLLHCIGKVDQPALGLALCLRDASVLDEVKRLSSQYQIRIVGHIRKAEKSLKETDHLRYVMLEDSMGIGIIASTMIRYVSPDKPVITLNKVEDKIKVSARGTRPLVDRGLDLATVMREAATTVGGQGGGHNIASGATIPLNSTDEFLRVVDRMVGEQLG